MKLSKIPEFSNYRIDLDAQQVYKIKNGILYPVNQRTRYKSMMMRDDNNKSINTTIYRVIWCTIHNVKHSQLPPNTIIVADDNGRGAKVSSRSEIQVKRAEALRKRRSMTIQKIQKEVDMVEGFMNGNAEPLLNYLDEIEKKVAKHYTYVRGLSVDRADIIAMSAVQEYLEDLYKGNVTIGAENHIFKRAYGVFMKRCDFTDTLKTQEQFTDIELE